MKGRALMALKHLSPSEQLVTIMHRIYESGLTTLSGGNLSIRDADGAIWITPAGIDKGALSADDIVRVLPDGDHQGRHKPSSELPFHQAIYAARPDLHAIVHAHTPALVSFSIVRQLPDASLLPQMHAVYGQVGYAPYALPGTQTLGANIAAAFAGGADVTLLENHGVVAAADTLLAAFQRVETLEFCARIEMYARRLGDLTKLSGRQAEALTLTLDAPTISDGESHRTEREHLAALVRRATRRQMMISASGTASLRLSETAFLITPHATDRGSLSADDLLHVDAAQAEIGYPAALHRQIYAHNPDVNAIIHAQPPYATAFTLCERRFDTHTIPESYMMLQDVAEVDFDAPYHHAAQLAQIIADDHPVLMIAHGGVLTTGKTLLKALDRLEVAEYTARSVIEAAAIGTLKPISDADIAAIRARYLP